MSQGPHGENCGDCYFFSPGEIPLEGEFRRKTASRSEDRNGYAGFCHRYPPPEECGESYIGPSVTMDDWCGEYAPHPETTELLKARRFLAEKFPRLEEK